MHIEAEKDLFKVTFKDKAAFQLKLGADGALAHYTSHPLLLHHNEARTTLYINSRPANPQALLEDIEKGIDSIFNGWHDWRSLFFGFGNYKAPAVALARQNIEQGGGILLDYAPASIIKVVTAVCEKHGVATRFFGSLDSIPSPRGVYSILFIGSCYVYEEFYDFLRDIPTEDEGVKSIAKPFLGNSGTLNQLLQDADKIYVQLASYYLKDQEGKAYYDDTPFALGPSFSGYTGILNCLKLLSDDNIVNIHTLNHDLFFERLCNSEWLANKVSDGFEELGSPYYGVLNANRRNYRVRLQRYTGRYNTPVRLYKLHGSRDYGVYYTNHNGFAHPEVYLKTRYGIGFGNF